MYGKLLPVGVALLGASTVLATTCSLENKCPKEAPCCSQYGECGAGAYCLGGCDPRMSFSLDACVPAPVCQDKTFKMDSTDRMVDISKYLGDPTKADWVYQGEPRAYNGNVLLTMPAHSPGTVVATTEYLWYGNIKAKLKTSRGAGVVTAFILLSDVKDEIDYEFVGTELTTAQTNYYFQGIPNYDNSANITLSDTYNDFHEYEIQWTPDTITWLVDGQVGRIKKRSETWNSTSNQWAYPQTPARLQISIWPAGDEKNPKGTVDWAGGPIDWNSDDIKKNGYYFATFGEVSVECYKGDGKIGTNSGKSYTYNGAACTNDTVVDGDKPTILKSFLGTGLDMDAGESSPSSKGSSTATNSVAPVATVPGGGGSVGTVPGGGSSGSDNGGSSGGGNGGDSGGDSGGDAAPTGPNAACATSGFSQSCGNGNPSNKNGGARGAERTLGASAFAVIIGFAGLLFL